jgi:hypothetical protein
MLKKMFLFAVFALFANFAHAAKSSVDITSEFDLPNSMSGCSIIRLKNDDFNATVLYVTRCPNAKTETTLPGKNPVHVISNSIIDNEASSADIKSLDVMVLNGDKYVPLDSLGNFDLSKTIEINGKKYVKIK